MMKCPVKLIIIVSAVLFTLVLGCAQQQVPQDMKGAPVEGAGKKSTPVLFFWRSPLTN